MEDASQARRLVELFNGVQRLAEALGRKEPGFAESEAPLLEAACRGTQLEDFGDDAFRTHLRVLLHAYDEEARLTPFGRLMVMGELSTVLANRLTVQDAWRRQ